MLIRKVHVRNYRSIADAVLECDPFTVLVGRNGAGKSTFLSALDTFYDVSRQLNEEDFHAKECSSPVEVSVTFSGLSDQEKSEFASYIRDEELIVTKRMTLEDGKPSSAYYAAGMQVPQFAVIRAITGDKRKAWKELVESEALPDLGPPSAKNSALVEEYMISYETEHPELLQPIEKEETFFGAKNVGGGKLDKYTRFILVPAVRDAEDETSGNKGAIYQIRNMIVLRKISAREEIKIQKTEIKLLTKEVSHHKKEKAKWDEKIKNNKQLKNINSVEDLVKFSNSIRRYQ